MLYTKYIGISIICFIIIFCTFKGLNLLQEYLFTSKTFHESTKQFDTFGYIDLKYGNCRYETH